MCPGPSLCVALHGISLSAAQLQQLMSVVATGRLSAGGISRAMAAAGSGAATAAGDVAAAGSRASGSSSNADQGPGQQAPVDGMAAVAAVQLGLQSVWAVTDVLQVTLVCCFSGFIHHSSGAVHLITLLTCAWLRHLTQYCRLSPASCWSHKSRLQVVDSDSCVPCCCLAMSLWCSC